LDRLARSRHEWFCLGVCRQGRSRRCRAADQFAINLRMPGVLGFSVTPSLLAQADEVIE
jgi:hypothetical protein